MRSLSIKMSFSPCFSPYLLAFLQIRFPLNPNNVEIYLVSCDGKHFLIKEPSFPQDPAFRSHKLKHAAVTYLMALTVTGSNIALVYGPFPASKADPTMYRESIRQQVIAAGGHAVADAVFQHFPEVDGADRPDLHTPATCRLLGRIKNHQEALFAMFTVYKVMKDEFRHIKYLMTDHAMFTNAVAVTIQYKMELGSPLFEAET